MEKLDFEKVKERMEKTSTNRIDELLFKACCFDELNKGIEITNLTTGETGVYRTQYEASKKTGLAQNYISLLVCGKKARKYRFRYAPYYTYEQFMEAVKEYGQKK